ncbi:hypothetical protein NPIL_264991 [Nephila pilipes]|uniref:Uncharacterized protein n=1 Tax=Nephila pilipes TaxID=299642 RepID=A0A8X6P6V4_NEPPI|nr:hypothetical protein NPIL_264991 [Nephila pilipes]
MFLLEARNSDVEGMDAMDTQEMNKRIKYRQEVRSYHRERFRVGYLGQLQQRTSHRSQVKILTVSDIVLLERVTVKNISNGHWLEYWN